MASGHGLETVFFLWSHQPAFHPSIVVQMRMAPIGSLHARFPLDGCLGRNRKFVLVGGSLSPGKGCEVSKAKTSSILVSLSLPTACGSGYKLLATASPSVSGLPACCHAYSYHGLWWSEYEWPPWLMCLNNWSIGNDTSRRYGFVGVDVALLAEVCPC